MLARSGARLVEVGTTNRTRVADYERALGPETAVILRVHQSNFRVVGFTEQPALASSPRLRARAGLPARRRPRLGRARRRSATSRRRRRASPREPTSSASRATSSSAARRPASSPGRAELIERLRRHPLQRALRADKLTLAALEGTLAARPRSRARARARCPCCGCSPSPSRRCGSEPSASPASSAARSRRRSPASAAARCRSTELPSFACAIEEALFDPLRAGEPPVVGIVRDGRLLLDVRALADGEIDEVARRGRRGAGRSARRALVARRVTKRTRVALTVGTAGHIDHGKTWLVRALTGKDTDRLPEEQRRGISIDLGYAPLELPDGRRLSLIDVPGPRALRPHDGRRRDRDRPLPARDRRGRGRTAADARAPRDPAAARRRGGRRRDHEGRPRRRGDARDRDRRGARARPGGGGRRGQRQDRGGARRAASGARAGRRPLGRRATRPGPARLYVDRVFTLRGIGTVVTGTLWSGTIAEGDVLQVAPRGGEVRVRSVQVHDARRRARDRRRAGRARAARASTGASCTAATRSSRPGAFPVSYRLDVELEELVPIDGGARVSVHHGTSRIPARVARVGERRRRSCGSRLPSSRRAATASSSAARRPSAARPCSTPPRRDGSTRSGSSCSSVATRPRSWRRPSTRPSRSSRSRPVACWLRPSSRRASRRSCRRAAGRSRRCGSRRRASRSSSACAPAPRQSPLEPGLAVAELLPPEPWAPAILPLLPIERRGGMAYLPGVAASLGARAAAAEELERELERRGPGGGQGRRRRACAVPRRRRDGSCGSATDSSSRRLPTSARASSSSRSARAAGEIALARFRDLAGVGRRDAQLLLERLDQDGVTRRLGDRRVLRRAGRTTA